MRVLSLHNCAKYSCFISINDKIINNLLRWGRFQPNVRRPLAAKLWMGAKMFGNQNDGTDHLYHHAKFGGNSATHVGVRGRNVMFFTFIYFYFFNGRICPWGSSAGISFTHGPILGYVAPIKVKFGREERT